MRGRTIRAGGADGEQRRSHPVERDRGSALLMALVVVMLASFVVVPLLRYTMTVVKQNQLAQAKSARLEAVKGGLRTALADPKALYKTCDAATLISGVTLSSPMLDTPVSTTCFKMLSQTAEDPADLWFGLATTSVGSTLPTGTGILGTPFPGSGASPPSAWLSSTTPDAQGSKVWLPRLPVNNKALRSAAGYSMPAGFAACTVFFPGTYTDPITITGTTPVYFASGVYYFENTVRISGDAKVVVGGGAEPGCVRSDQEAAFYATNAPASHGISGLGGTFILGRGARFVVDQATAGSSMSVVFNRRYAAASDTASAASVGVSIETVNGVESGATNVDYSTPFVMVPASTVAGGASSVAADHGYHASSVAWPSPLDPAVPVVQIDLTTTATARVVIPGYISAPQGVVAVRTSAGATANKNVQLTGGVLAAGLDLGAARPATFKLGLDNPIVLQTFKIVSTTTSGTPVVTSSAVVQLKENGAFAVNSWQTQ
jgi:type II secretory pathway pseudopilin PulG